MYIDTSLLVPYYCPETLSRKAERILRGDAHPAVSDLVEVEFFSALAKKVRAREMLAADATRTGEQFLGHLHAAMYTRFSASAASLRSRPQLAGAIRLADSCAGRPASRDRRR